MITAKKLIGIVFLGTTLAGMLWGQEAVDEPAVAEEPVVDIGNGVPGADTSPDTGTLRAGIAESAATFGIGRRMHLAASVTGGYDDNVNTSPTGSPSWFASPNGTFSYEFGNQRLAFTTILGAGLTYYFEHPGGRDYDPNLNLRFTIGFKATPRLTLTLTSINAYQSEPDYTTDLNLNHNVGNHIRSINHLSARYRLSARLTTVTSYSLGLLQSDNSSGATTGGLNSANDQVQSILGEQLRYLLLPTTTATGEYRYGITDHSGGSGSSKQNGSTTQTFALGAEQSFSPRLSAKLKAGLQLRSNGNNSDKIAPYFESNILYLFGTTLPSSTAGTAGASIGGSTQQLGSFVSWTNRYSFEESDQVGAESRETFRTHLQFSYPLTDRISASLSLVYFHGENQSSNTRSSNSSTEDLFDIAPTLRYAINTRYSFTIGYRHTEFDGGKASNTFDSEAFGYSRSRYFAGVNVNF